MLTLLQNDRATYDKYGKKMVSMEAVAYECGL
jgi:hypothetical protein